LGRAARRAHGRSARARRSPARGGAAGGARDEGGRDALADLDQRRGDPLRRDDAQGRGRDRGRGGRRTRGGGRPSSRVARTLSRRTGGSMLDIPDAVRNYAIAEGCTGWLHELPTIVHSLAHDWSLTIGATLHGGHAAFVAEATTPVGAGVVLKVAVPC